MGPMESPMADDSPDDARPRRWGFSGENRPGPVIVLPADFKDLTVLIDLARVSYLNSESAAHFITLMEVVVERGGDIAFFGVGENVRRFLEAAKLDKVFRIHASYEEALAGRARYTAMAGSLPAATQRL